MDVLLAVDTVHTAAAVCDYVQERGGELDAITAVAVASPDSPDARMDAEEALNVVRVRLAGFEGVETVVVEADHPSSAILECAERDDADELVVGVRGGRPDATEAVGSTTTAILAETVRPVAVVALEW